MSTTLSFIQTTLEIWYLPFSLQRHLGRPRPGEEHANTFIRLKAASCPSF